jgi:hypothetical protein
MLMLFTVAEIVITYLNPTIAAFGAVVGTDAKIVIGIAVFCLYW